jgi:crotonobetainyl-CoA:carnitine CoA-transferase CaiB-like acyl-CoA transferase
MDSEGMAPQYMKEIDWDSLDFARLDQETLEEVTRPVEEFFKCHTRAELYQDGFTKWQCLIYPVSDRKGIFEDIQLKARGLWIDIMHDKLNLSIKYAGPFVQGSMQFCTFRRPPPVIGEHNEEVFMGELGFSRQKLSSLLWQ